MEGNRLLDAQVQLQELQTQDLTLCIDVALKRVHKTLSHLMCATKESDQQDAFEKTQIEPCDCSSTPKKPVNQLLDSGTRGGHHQGKEPFKWNGWGYSDCEFALNEQGHLYLTGKRYDLCGVAFPKMRPWAEKLLGLNIQVKSPPQKEMKGIKAPIRNEQFLQDIKNSYVKLSFEESDRLFHGHGHTCDDIYRLRYGTFDRLPDVVVWPGNHSQVEAIVQAAVKHSVVIIPFGGGTSVSNAIECPTKENRMVVSLDMHEMNRIKWIDHESMMACIECGIIGKDLDAKLSKLGLCMGHEPDSSEYSSLGGWISTRASGMKKNVYGNIEDIIINVKVVTPIGTIEKGCNVPRMSTGPDIKEIVLGSEGTFGVVTEAIVKLRPLPEARRYGSIVFPDFESGVACLREIAKQKCAPASIRLMDNLQFQFGQVLKPDKESVTEEWLDAAKKWYVTNYRGYDVDKMCAATLLFEGNAQDLVAQERKVYSIASRYGGIKGGEENGRRGYFLTYMIAYIRDFGFNYYFMAESFETSVPWSKCLELCDKVKERIRISCKEKGITYNPFVTCRVTQTYDTGACVYFYFGFIYKELVDPLKTYLEIENEAREEILKCNGSLSHHHGVGKLRKKWLPGIDLIYQFNKCQKQYLQVVCLF